MPSTESQLCFAVLGDAGLSPCCVHPAKKMKALLFPLKLILMGIWSLMQRSAGDFFFPSLRLFQLEKINSGQKAIGSKNVWELL